MAKTAVTINLEPEIAERLREEHKGAVSYHVQLCLEAYDAFKDLKMHHKALQQSYDAARRRIEELEAKQ
jgi:hypothetical protein